ncbi:MAG: S-layer homology domain-containing protein [Clostridia bacterium]|nr:S-layer homology domain-containing protein [Clostridia bacterium]
MKTSKKYLSLFLAAIMMLSGLSLPATAAPSPTSLTPTGDVYIGYSSSAPVVNSYNFVRIYKRVPSPTGWNHGSVGAFSYDISDVWSTLEANAGYVVKSAKWKAYVKYAGTNASSCKFNFYMMDTQWTESTISKNTLPANVASYPVWNNAPDASYNSTITTSKQLQTYDLTSVLKKHMRENKNEANKNFFSFALDFTTNGQAECDIDANSATNPSANAAVLEIEYIQPDPLAIDGEPVLPTASDEDAVITYNNNIASAVAKVNGADVDAQYITVENKTVTIDKGAFEQCNVLEVCVNDEYGFSIKSIYAFVVDNGIGDNNLLRVEYDSDSAAATVYYINKAYCNSPVTVLVAETDDTEYYCSSDSLSTDSAGVLVYNIPATISNDESYIVYVSHEDGTTLHADVVNDAYTTFLWTLAAQSTDVAAIKERFGVICSAFGLTVGYSDKIVDIDDFYDKLVSLRASYSIGDKNAENESKLETAFEEIGLFTATEDITELTAPSDARELYDAMLAKIADRSFADKLAELEAQCSSDGSPFFADVYNGFIGSSKTINSYADFEKELKESYNTEKSAVLLGEFAAMTHISQVGALLNSPEAIDAFGIASLVDRYNALNSTSEVDNALYGKTFANNSAFISALSSALTSAERVDPPAPQKPSSRPSKGGSAIVGAIGAPVDTTPIVNNEKPSYENSSYSDLAGYDWAKEHIAALSADGIINGKGDGEFDPAGKVLREEAVKMIVEAFDITASGDAAFDDVSSADWFRGFVLTAKNAGIVNGVSDSSFGAGLSITRQDAAVMLFTALSKKGLASAIAGSDSSFADDADIAAYAREAVAYMNSVGAITGYADGTFKPMSTITRAEFAVVLGRIYNTLK